MSFYNKHVFLCTNQKALGKSCCANVGGQVFFDYMKAKLSEYGLQGPEKIRVSKSGCLGRCSAGPCLVIYPDGIWYRYETTADIDEIINTHLIAQQIVKRLLIS